MNDFVFLEYIYKKKQANTNKKRAKKIYTFILSWNRLYYL